MQFKTSAVAFLTLFTATSIVSGDMLTIGGSSQTLVEKVQKSQNASPAAGQGGFGTGGVADPPKGQPLTPPKGSVAAPPKSPKASK